MKICMIRSGWKLNDTYEIVAGRFKKDYKIFGKNVLQNIFSVSFQSDIGRRTCILWDKKYCTQFDESCKIGYISGHFSFGLHDRRIKMNFRNYSLSLY